MSVILKSSSIIAEPASLSLFGPQTDPNGVVMGGHKAIFDFSAPTMPNTLAISGEVPNLLYSGEPAVCTGAFSGITVAKGLPFTDSVAGEKMTLPDSFKLNSLGAEPSFVLSTWLTHSVAETDDSGAASIAGYAFQTGADHQWSISVLNSNIVYFNYTVAGQSRRVLEVCRLNDVPGSRGAPMLITAYIEKAGAGIFTGSVYLNDAIAASVSGETYSTGFNAPGGGYVPTIGQLGGFSGDWDGVLHRMQLLKVDPESFDVDDWLKTEIAANASRLAA